MNEFGKDWFVVRCRLIVAIGLVKPMVRGWYLAGQTV
jgi:hypothetical protein